MSAFLSSLVFVHPWILTAAIILPLLWFLLRVSPPAPKRQMFPPLRFLKELVPERTTPSTTPWWLLLLRCLIVAFAILALARPVLNPSEGLPGSADVRLVIENGWAAAQSWDDQMKAAEDIIAQAEREGRAVYLLTTAPDMGSDRVRQEGPLPASQARSMLRGITPHPYPSDFAQTAKQVQNSAYENSMHSFVIGTGLQDSGFDAFIRALQNDGGLTYYTPDTNELPVLLKPAEGDVAFSVEFADQSAAALPFTVHAIGSEGRILDYKTLMLGPDSEAFSFDLPETTGADLSRIDVTARRGAGGTWLQDDRSRKRHVGIAGGGADTDPTPLIDAVYYLTRALEPYAHLHTGTIEELIDANVSALILPDVAAMTPSTLATLEDWVKDGGLLLRFAGPAMSAGENFLTPVPLLKGTRSLAGDLTWDEPQALAPFPEDSPLYGIRFEDKIDVQQQILAQPVPDLDDKTWAALEDGTPLITASKMEQGMLVLVHTTATPDWSNLALSGLYVDVLRRIVSLAGSPSIKSQANTSLQPVSVMDGFGSLIDPKGVQPIAAEEFDTLSPSAMHPPGLYGRPGQVQAFNLGGRLKPLHAVESLPAGSVFHIYDQNYETDLMPLFLSLALALLLLDWMIVLAMNTTFRLPRFAAALLILVFMPLQAQAQDSIDAQYAGHIYLAFMQTNDPALNDLTKRGLEGLSRILTQRTSVEPKGVVALNPETDTLSFYPFIYWPVSDKPVPLSDNAIKAIQHYLDHGGSILFDTRDQGYSSGGMTSTPNARALQHMTAALNIPTLIKAPDDHVLRKSFYLLDGFPGRYTDGPLWVEQQSASGRDNVSSVLIGGNDWASAWAAQQNGGSLTPYLTGGPRQQEMAFRFGVNMMMYALTGNYKADQVHLPFILERLDQ